MDSINNLVLTFIDKCVGECDLTSPTLASDLKSLWKNDDNQKSLVDCLPTKTRKKTKTRTKTVSKREVNKKNTIPKPNKYQRKKVASDAPKKPKTAYLLFCADTRKKIADELGLSGNHKSVLKELGARWKVLKNGNSNQMEEYNKIAHEDKVRYFNELEQYKNKDVDASDTTPDADSFTNTNNDNDVNDSAPPCEQQDGTTTTVDERADERERCVDYIKNHMEEEISNNPDLSRDEVKKILVEKFKANDGRDSDI